MQPQTFRQSGMWMIAIMVMVIIFCVTLLLNNLDKGSNIVWILGSIIVVLLICLFNFDRLTITVTDKTVSFRMGMGLIRRSYKISDLKSCEEVKNNLLLGLGIHWFPGGVLYNVSGTKAIELRFKHCRSVVRIGTDRPEEIAKLINLLIDK